MLHVRFACNTPAWGDAPLETLLSELSQIGFHGVELPAHTLEADTDTIRELLERYRIDLSSAVLPVSFIHPEEFEAELDKIERVAQLLLEYDCLQLTVVGQPVERAQITGEISTRFIAGCNEAGRRCLQHGIQLMLRNQTGTVFGSRRQIESIAAATEPDYVALAFDTAELLRGHASPAWTCRAYRNRIAYITFSDSSDGRPVPLGYGEIDIPAILRTLYKSNYTGWFVLDPGYRPAQAGVRDYQTAPIYSPQELAQISHKYMRSLWAA